MAAVLGGSVANASAITIVLAGGPQDCCVFRPIQRERENTELVALKSVRQLTTQQQPSSGCCQFSFSLPASTNWQSKQMYQPTSGNSTLALTHHSSLSIELKPAFQCSLALPVLLPLPRAIQAESVTSDLGPAPLIKMPSSILSLLASSYWARQMMRGFDGRAHREERVEL